MFDRKIRPHTHHFHRSTRAVVRAGRVASIGRRRTDIGAAVTRKSFAKWRWLIPLAMPWSKRVAAVRGSIAGAIRPRRQSSGAEPALAHPVLSYPPQRSPDAVPQRALFRAYAGETFAADPNPLLWVFLPVATFKNLEPAAVALDQTKIVAVCDFLIDAAAVRCSHLVRFVRHWQIACRRDKHLAKLFAFSFFWGIASVANWLGSIAVALFSIPRVGGRSGLSLGQGF
jgi:hypothetical protein